MGQLQNCQLFNSHFREQQNGNNSNDNTGQRSENICSFYWKGRLSDKENSDIRPEANRSTSVKRIRESSDFRDLPDSKVRKVALVEPIPRRQNINTLMADQGVPADNILDNVGWGDLLSDSDDESVGMFNQIVRKRLTDTDAYPALPGLCISSWRRMDSADKLYLATVLEQWKIAAQHASQASGADARTLALLEDFVINVNANINQLDDIEQNGAFVFALSDRNHLRPLALVFVEPSGNRAEIRFIQYDPVQFEDTVTFLKDQLVPVLFNTLRNHSFHEIETTAYSEELTSLYSELDFDIIEN